MSDVSHCPRWVTNLQDARCTKFVLKGPGLDEFRTGWPSENALNIALDGIDAKIRGLLHGNSRMTNSEVARRLGLAEAPVRKWVGRRLENAVMQFQGDGEEVQGRPANHLSNPVRRPAGGQGSAVAKTGRLVVVHEAWGPCGVGEIGRAHV